MKELKKNRETGNLKHLYRNELDKAYFAHDAAYSDSKYLPKRTILDKVPKDRPFQIAWNCNYDGYQRALAIMVYKFFDKKTALGAIATNKAGISVNEQLDKNLHQPVIKKFKRRKVYERFKDNIWVADLAKIESLSCKKMLNIYYMS